MSISSKNLEAALQYPKNGWAVFPCNMEKRPITKNGFYDATCDPEVISDWWTCNPDALIGCPTGEKIGLWVLDVDLPDGPETLASLEAENGPLPATKEQRTGSGGSQLFFKWIDGREVRNSASKLGPGLDVRGEGGYVILPPSGHKSGGTYEWVSGDTPAAEAPDWLLDLVVKQHQKHQEADSEPRALHEQKGASPYGEKALKEECREVSGATNGTRNDTLNKAAFALGQLVAGGAVDGHEAEQELMAAAASCGIPQREARKTIAGAMKAGMDKPRCASKKQRATANTHGPASENQDTGAPQTQSSQFLAMQHVLEEVGRENIVYSMGSFWRWCGSGVWKRVEDIAIKQIAQSCEAGNRELTGYFISNVRSLVQNEVYIPENRFDHDLRAINCRNGEIHWSETGWQLRPHALENYRTTQIPVEYDPAAKAPRFIQFLDEIFRDDPDKPQKKLIVCEAIGYTLLSTCEYEKFLMLIGPGANGKSALMDVVTALVGVQNTTAVQPSQFENKFQRAHLHGKLANMVTEIAEGAEIADAQLKAIVSGELTTAEHKLKPPFEFSPICTCWFGTNHMPHTRDFSDALFRRAIIITFNRIFKEEEQDKKLKEKLRAELPGILNLALKGIAGVFRRGQFTVSESSEEAKREWRTEADQVAQFIEEECIKVPRHEESSANMYQRYQQWAEDAGIRKTLNRKNFTERLCRLGGEKMRSTNGKRNILGFRLRNVFLTSL